MCPSSRVSNWKHLLPYLWASFYGLLLYIIFSIVFSNVLASLLIFISIVSTLFVVLIVIGFVKRQKGESHIYFDF